MQFVGVVKATVTPFSPKTLVARVSTGRTERRRTANGIMTMVQNRGRVPLMVEARAAR